MFEKYIAEYGTRGGQMLIRRVVEDWLALEANAKLDPTDPIRVAANEVIDRVLPALTAALEEIRDHQTAVTHLRDDFERLRTRVLRRLSRELDLLDEGMGAIRREPPRLHVMLDHGERATSGLREEIKNLEREAQR